MTRGARFRVTSHVQRSIALAVIAWLACVTQARAASDASGTAAASFLSVGSGASVLSMAGATLATGTDLAAAAWNPASLARVDALQFSLTHAPLPGGATQEWLAAGGRMGGDWRWSTQMLFHREGGIEGRDAANNPTGELSASDVGVGAHLARRFGGVVDVGLGAEWIHESLAGTAGSGLAFSGGVRTRSGPFGFGIAARHIGGGMSYGGTRYDLPGVIALGTSYEDAARGLRFAADLESPTHYYRSLRVGGEYMWRGQLAVRAGYRSELGNTDAARLSGPTFGVGTGAGSMWLDYGFMPGGGEGAGEHRLGLTFRPAGSSRGGAMGSTTPPPAQPRAAKAAPSAKAAPAQAKPSASASAPVSAPASAAPSEAAPMPNAEAKKPETAPKTDASSEIPVPAPTPLLGQGAGAAAGAGAKVAPPANSGSNNTSSATAGAPVKSAPEKRAIAEDPKAASTATATTAAAKADAPKVESGPKSAPPATPGNGVTLASSKPPVETVVRERPKFIHVGHGETLALIAKRWDTSVAAIMMANDKTNEKVTPGQKLKLPPAEKRGGPRHTITIR